MESVKGYLMDGFMVGMGVFVAVGEDFGRFFFFDQLKKLLIDFFGFCVVNEVEFFEVVEDDVAIEDFTGFEGFRGAHFLHDFFF